MDSHVSIRPQPWLVELGGCGGRVGLSGTQPLTAAGELWTEQGAPTLRPCAQAQPLGFCLIDSLVPVQAMLSLNSLATVLFCFWLGPLFFKMDAWSIMSCRAQGRFKDFPG